MYVHMYRGVSGLLLYTKRIVFASLYRLRIRGIVMIKAGMGYCTVCASFTFLPYTIVLDRD